MSAPQFTPGGWAVHPLRASVYVVPQAHTERPIGGAEDAAYDLDNYAQEICLLHHPDRHRSEAEVYSNACLIAAAPELYEALVAMVEWNIKRGPFDEPLGESEQEDEVNAAVRALAKARGEQ